ncbi:MAG: glycosyltransferase 61 family protein [Pleurocapsa sp.]
MSLLFYSSSESLIKQKQRNPFSDINQMSQGFINNCKINIIRLSIVKTLVNIILVVIATARLYRNQQSIIKVSKKEKLLLIEIDSHKGTSKDSKDVKNYFHFFFDLVLPLYYLIKNTDDDVVFIVKLNNHLDKIKTLFPKRVITIKNDVNDNTRDIQNAYCVKMLGMNPKVVCLSTRFLESFKKDIFRQLHIKTKNDCPKILLIERSKLSPNLINQPLDKETLDKHTYYNIVFSRVIINHDELKSKIESIVGYYPEFHNLRLETLSIQEQMEYFDTATIVIAQHGAGLTNCLWMRANTILIELNNDDSYYFRHFRYLSRWKKIKYFNYKTSDLHANIDVNHFSTWLLSLPEIKSLLANECN